jgi:hypothetical protein
MNRTQRDRLKRYCDQAKRANARHQPAAPIGSLPDDPPAFTKPPKAPPAEAPAEPRHARLPHNSVMNLGFNEETGTWSGSLVVPVPGHIPLTFFASARAVLTLCNKLGQQWFKHKRAHG